MGKPAPLQFRIGILLGLAVALATVGIPSARAGDEIVGQLGLHDDFLPISEPSLQPVVTRGEAVALIPLGLERPLPPPVLMPDVVQVAYDQEPTAVPPLPPGQAAPAAPLGEAPVDNSEVFLREETVLLSPGQIAVDYGAEYVSAIAVQAAALSGGTGGEELRLRRFIAPLAVRYGLTDRLQPYLNLPVGGALFQDEDATHDSFNSVGGLGDIGAGVSYLLHRHDECTPDVILQTGLTAPTGASPFRGDFLVASMGAGTWTASTGVLVVKTFDPVVLFGGVGYTHLFSGSQGGTEIGAVERGTYQFGCGYAVNDIITFSTTFLGSAQTSYKLNQTWIPDSSLEPFSVNLAVTVVVNPCLVVQPFLRFGLDVDAPSADFGVTATRTF